MTKFDMEIGPFLEKKITTKKMMLNLLIAIIPIILFSTYRHGYLPYKEGLTNFVGIFYPIFLILITSSLGILIEFMHAKLILKRSLKKAVLYAKNSYGFWPGLFIVLISPINTPIWLLIVATMFGVIMGKLFYGGLGKNLFNPALLGAFLIITLTSFNLVKPVSYLNKYEVETISVATPLSNIKALGKDLTYEKAIKPFGNLKDMFFGNVPGATGETSSLLILLAFIYLTFTKTIKWRISVSYISTVFVASYLISLIAGIGPWFPMMHLLTGGLLFGAVFMATDPVTSPMPALTQIIFGLFLGILTLIFRHILLYPEGVLISILILNAFVPFLNKLGAKARFNFDKVAPYFVIGLILVGFLGIHIGNSYKVNTGVVDPKDPNKPPVIEEKDFSVENERIENGTYIYNVEQKSFSHKIKAEIMINGRGLIIEINIDKKSLGNYEKTAVEDGIIKRLLKNANRLDSVETTSGATISSNKIIEMVIKTLEYHNEKVGK